MEFKQSAGWSIAYKFKDKKDSLVNVEYSDKEEIEIFLITEKGMGIKFKANTVSTMGKLAAGVTAISLKEDDRISYCFLIDSDDSKDYKLNLISEKGNKEQINLKDVVLQNRAGRGKSIMLIVMDDKIKKVY